MSGIAGMFLDCGYTNIIWVDTAVSQLTQNLEKRWIPITYGHGKITIHPGDAVIYSAAAVDSPEVKQAKEIASSYSKGMLVANYFEFLGEISKYFVSIGIAGTNGKSSTTALMIHAASKSLPDCAGWILGALVPSLWNQSYYINPTHKSFIANVLHHICTGKWLDTTQLKKYLFIIEACEYRRHFLHLDLDYTIITNIELDHTDYYKDEADYIDAFTSLIDRTKRKVFVADDITVRSDDKVQKIKTQSQNISHLSNHNDTNGSLVQACLETVKPNTIDRKTARSNFAGLRRRMEYLGEVNTNPIYTDYAHMASSIDAIYQLMRFKHPDKKLVCIFQPHQAQRVLQDRDHFTSVMKQFDQAYIYDMYTARENLEELTQKFSKKANNVTELWQLFAAQCNAPYYTSIKQLQSIITTTAQDSIIILCTAGDADFQLRQILKNI